MNTVTLTTDKANITQTRWSDVPSAALQDGQVRLTIEHFAFTANNATYAAFGKTMNYWDFFPQADVLWGCIPVWGYAVVQESRCADVNIGDRFYGYYPFANKVVMQPVRVSESGFVDGAVHRSHLHALYNQYTNVAKDPSHHPTFDNLNALLRPLFITSFLIDDYFADQHFLGAQAIVLSSASSKTAFGTAYCLAQRGKAKPKIIGLTSGSHVEFTQRLGLYDQVLSYDDVAALDGVVSTIYLDFSGSGGVRAAVHEHCKGLAYSCAIGGTHWQDLKSGEQLPGPKPTLFFAPAQLKKRIADWGGAVLQTKVGTVMQSFMKAAADPKAPWLAIQRHRGRDAALQVYDAVIAGRAKPETGFMISL